jgi:hypothetical protein
VFVKDALGSVASLNPPGSRRKKMKASIFLKAHSYIIGNYVYHLKECFVSIIDGELNKFTKLIKAKHPTT